MNNLAIDEGFAALKLDVQTHFRKKLINDLLPEAVSNDHSDPSFPPTAEQVLWAAVLQSVIDDYHKVNNVGESGWMQPCIPCHEKASCECLISWVAHRGHGRAKGCRVCGPRRRHHVGFLGFLPDWRACRNHHTLHQCAVRWLASDEVEEGSFAWICEYLGFNLDSTRRRIRSMAS